MVQIQFMKPKSKKPIVSLKFGGTSMGTADSIKQCAEIVQVESKKSSVVATVSAVSGVTNQILALIDLAKNQKPRLVTQEIQQLEKKHQQIMQSFFDDEQAFQNAWKQDFEPIFEKLK